MVPGAGGATLPVVVLGGSGYVAGEALRLLAAHPRLRLAAVVSESQGGQPVAEAFPHLSGSYPELRFSALGDLERLMETVRPAAALCAAPHGAAARIVDGLLSTAEHAGVRLTVVDLSADFRFVAAADYERVYGHAHGAPHRLEQFRCVLPEHAELASGSAALPGGHASGDAQPMERDGSDGAPTRLDGLDDPRSGRDGLEAAPSGRDRLDAARLGRGSGDAPRKGALAGHAAAPGGHIGHPGCFPTAVLLAAVPLVRLGWIEPTVHVVAVTGSTGAGRTPSATTHHPARRSNLFAYSPLSHRHEPEMRELAAAAAGMPVTIHFVPQAGPFARGIYATLQARLLRPVPARQEAELAAAVAADLGRFYVAAPFVDVAAVPPRLQDVVGSNRCRIGITARGDRLVAFSAIDNLTKGAAGGGIQWLNRLLGCGETCGLDQPGIGWL